MRFSGAENKILKVFVPFFQNIPKEFGFSEKTHALIIWNIWHSHIEKSIIELCSKHYIKIAIITPGFTSDLQVMDKPMKN